MRGQDKRSRWALFVPGRLKAGKEYYRIVRKLAMQNQPLWLLEGPLALQMVCMYRYRSRLGKKWIEQWLTRPPRFTRPALRSNKGGLSALITDALRALEGVVFASRSQIAAEMGVFKVWGPEDGLYIHVLEMEGSSIDIGCLIEQIVLACKPACDLTFLDTGAAG